MSIIGSQRIDSLGTYFKDFLTKPDNVALIMKVLSSDGSGEYFILPFFPESVSDSKSVNWNNIELPGASHPIYQYVNSGERTISFTAKLLRISWSRWRVNSNKNNTCIPIFLRSIPSWHNRSRPSNLAFNKRRYCSIPITKSKNTSISINNCTYSIGKNYHK